MTRTKRLVALLYGLFGILAFAGGPPPGRFTFRSYGSEQGLRNLAVMGLLEDKQGFLWLGTEDGLSRYDGHHFQDFGTREGLPSSYITALEEDSEGRLWAGTYQGLACRDGEGPFKPVPPGRGLPAGAVHALSAGPDGRLWAATDAGPFALSPSDRFNPVPGWPGGVASAVCCCPEPDHGWAALWEASGPRKGTRLFEYRGGSWTPWEEPTAFGHERLDTLLEDADGNLWARGPRHLWLRRRGEARFSEPLPGLPPISARAALSLGRNGTLFVPTDKGVYSFEQGAWKVLDQGRGLPTDYARDVLQDREGSLWVASLGVHRLLGRGLWSAYTQREGLPDDVTWTILRDRGGDLLVGTDGGLLRATDKGWQMLDGTAGTVVRSAVEAPDGTLYLGGVPVQVLRWNPKTRKVDGRFGLESGLVGKRIFRLVLDREGRLWAATDGGGLLRADTRDPQLRFENIILPGGSATEYISGLALGASGRLYASGERGLAVLEQGQWRRYTEADGLDRTHVAYAAETRNGDLLVAYFEALGYSRVRIQGGHLQVVERPDPAGELGREKVYMMGEDSAGREWIGTGRGVYAVKGGEVQRFGLSDGLVGEDIDNMAFFADPGGDVWVGTSSGLARFASSADQGPLEPPPTAFLSCALGGQARDLAGGARVPHREGTLEARFAGLSFLGEGFVNYQVRLRGLEEAWHATDTQEARYPALGQGSYVLEVRSRVGHGPWGPPAAFAFEVLPAWWQTWWFRLLALAAFAGAIAGILRWRLAALRRHNQELEALVHQRTAELEVANEALRNQSLTDPLTGLRNRRYLGVRMPEDLAQLSRAQREIHEKRRDREQVNIDLVFVMVDLDHFKEVNDTYGHAAGDHVLRQTAEILRGATRDSDTVVRWGGEEFLVVARNAARKDAMALAERIRSRMEAHPFDLGDGQTLRRTCSVGFTFFPFLHSNPDLMGWEQVVDLADHCLYAAKRSGRNGWVGITAADGLDPVHLEERLASRIPELLDSGVLQVQISFPEGTELHWEK